MARNGIGKSSKSETLDTGRVRLRSIRSPSLEPDVQVDWKVFCVLLAPESQIAALGFIRHRIRPVHLRDQLLEFVNAHARCIQATYDCTHAGTGDCVDGYAHAFELAEHTDMCGSARAAATQHQSYSKPVR
jgi:hypothetical protein